MWIDACHNSSPMAKWVKATTQHTAVAKHNRIQIHNGKEPEARLRMSAEPSYIRYPTFRWWEKTCTRAAVKMVITLSCNTVMQQHVVEFLITTSERQISHCGAIGGPSVEVVLDGVPTFAWPK